MNLKVSINLESEREGYGCIEMVMIFPKKLNQTLSEKERENMCAKVT